MSVRMRKKKKRDGQGCVFMAYWRHEINSPPAPCKWTAQNKTIDRHV